MLYSYFSFSVPIVRRFFVGAFSLITVQFFFFFFPIQAHAGAWLMEEGESQLITGMSYLESHRFFDAEGDRKTVERFQKLEWGGFFEHGLTSGITVGGEWRGVYATQEVLGQPYDVAGLEQLSAFVRIPLWQDDRQIISAEASLGWNNPFNVSDFPPLVEPEVFPAIALAYGRGFQAWGQQHYVDIQAGYALHSGKVSDEVKLSATLGLAGNARWLWLAQGFATISTDDTKTNALGAANPQNYDQFRLAGSGVYRINDALALQAGVFKDVAGRNTGQSQGVLTGLWIRW